MNGLLDTVRIGMLAAVLPFGATAAQESGETEPLYVEVTKLLASDGGVGDHFGDTLEIDGDTLVVGGDDIGVGGAYVFERKQRGSNAWGEVVKLLAPDQSQNFGRSVEVEGDLIAVGASDVELAGAVYFYERDAGGPDNWGFTGKLQAPGGPIAGQVFATPTIEGDELLVGATGDEEGGGFATGAIFVFERDESLPDGWRFEQKIIASDPSVLARFGQVLGIDGGTFVAAAPQDSEFEDFGGAAYIFEKEGELWVERKKLTAPVPESDGSFGEGLSIEGDLIAVGHPGEAGNYGAVYVYARNLGGPDNWGLEARLTGSVGGLVGASVDLDQHKLVVGADLSDGQDIENIGAVYVFQRSSAGNWTELVRLEASDRAESQQFGTAVGISGGTLIAGADLDNDGGSRAGAAYVFQVTAHPRITITGTCPGEITLELSGATPAGPVFVASSTSEGTTILPTGACAGVELGLEDARPLARLLAGDDGTRILVQTAPAEACGLYLQAVDAITCGVGPVTQVP